MIYLIQQIVISLYNRIICLDHLENQNVIAHQGED
jgi:hypothetical protein